MLAVSLFFSQASLAEWKIDPAVLNDLSAQAMRVDASMPILKARDLGGVTESGRNGPDDKLVLNSSGAAMPLNFALDFVLPSDWEVRTEISDFSQVYASWREGDELVGVLDKVSMRYPLRFHIDHKFHRIFIDQAEAPVGSGRELDLEAGGISGTYFLAFRDGKSDLDSLRDREGLRKIHSELVGRLGEIKSIEVVGVSHSIAQGNSTLASGRADTIASYFEAYTPFGAFVDTSLDVKNHQPDYRAGAEVNITYFDTASEEMLMADEVIPAEFVPVDPEFIRFEIGVYRALDMAGQKLVADFVDGIDYRNSQILVTGYSNSRSDNSSERLAQLRAITVRDELVRRGVPVSQIQITGVSENWVSGKPLVHGAEVYAAPMDATFASTDVIDPALEKLSRGELVCGVVDIKKGSLRNNMDRNLAACGFAIRDWGFRDNAGMVKDWRIPEEYLAVEGDSVEDVLEFFLNKYGLAASISDIYVDVRAASIRNSD